MFIRLSEQYFNEKFKQNFGQSLGTELQYCINQHTKAHNRIGIWYLLVSELKYRIIGLSAKFHIGASLDRDMFTGITGVLVHYCMLVAYVIA